MDYVSLLEILLLPIKLEGFYTVGLVPVVKVVALHEAVVVSDIVEGSLLLQFRLVVGSGGHVEE